MAAAMLWSKAEVKSSGYVGREPLSVRAQEISRSHEEMLGLLRGLPETEYELSFTDLVERTTSAVVDGEGTATAAAGEDAAAAGQGGDKAKETGMRRSSSERRAGGGCKEGVLLNVYFPSSLSRSLTESRVRRATGKRSAPGDCIKRDRQRLAFGCWSAIWERGRGKARRQ
ncbi:hypothetical protein Taro_012976 [Colocasia esculenta]|uniref:Uncharacterized protein n=1 Tax=Colocasia esculenta TaxID=4460 RepID=A0A843UAP2_COLES|nr:hypothetical protein [Colocasia esculenta]